MGKYPRQGGILLHPTSLPCKYGIGELGGSIYDFLDLLDDLNLSLWQVLPLGPTGYGDSPYQSFSSFAGNPLLISIEELIAEGLLDEVEDVPNFDRKSVEYGPVIEYKFSLLRRAYENFKSKANSDLEKEFHEFVTTQGDWLQNYALYRTIKSEHGEKPWNNWEPALRDMEPTAIEMFAQDHQDKLDYIKFRQFIFERQWKKVRKYAKSKNVRIIGDIPIFVAYDSEDTWANQENFQLDDEGNPTQVAGVPPDYFSETGQLWGNPIYDWNYLEENGFDWWIQRIKRTLEFADLIRVDHFRGFEAFWSIPAEENTAINGEWVKAPGKKLFETLKEELGELPILAEDLGVITPEVEALRDDFGFPGMKILQYGFSDDMDPKNTFLPHNYIPNCVAYTGTHDNDTSFGWYVNVDKKTKKHFQVYSGSDEHDVVSDMIRQVWGSVAMFAIIPFQDVLRENSDGRMNFPGKASGNWRWRYKLSQLEKNKKNIDELHRFTELYRRSKEVIGEELTSPHQ